MIVIDRPDLKIEVELRPDPPEPARYVDVFGLVRAGEKFSFRLAAAEAITLADALRVAAMRGRLVES